MTHWLQVIKRIVYKLGFGLYVLWLVTFHRKKDIDDGFNQEREEP